MTKEEFDMFARDYLTWVARVRVRWYQNEQEKRQRLFLDEQRKKNREYRLKIESYKQISINFD